MAEKHSLQVVDGQTDKKELLTNEFSLNLHDLFVR